MRRSRSAEERIIAILAEQERGPDGPEREVRMSVRAGNYWGTAPESTMNT